MNPTQKQFSLNRGASNPDQRKLPVFIFLHGNGHYGGKAEVYMDVGEAMGKAIVELLKRNC